MTGFIDVNDLGIADAHRSDFAEKADDSKSLRSMIGRGLEKVYDDAEREEGLEDAREVQKKVEDRFGASAGDVLAHFQGLDAEMRQNPVAGLAKAEEFFLKAGHAPVTRLKDLKPAADRHTNQRLSEMARGDDLRAHIAKSYSQTIDRAEASTRLEDAAKNVRGPIKNALERILSVTELGATNPSLAAAQWFSTSTFPSKSDLDQPAPQQEAYRALDHLLGAEFADLEPHVEKITQMVQSGKLKPSGDLRIDMRNARKLLRGK